MKQAAYRVYLRRSAWWKLPYLFPFFIHRDIWVVHWHEYLCWPKIGTDVWELPASLCLLRSRRGLIIAVLPAGITWTRPGRARNERRPTWLPNKARNIGGVMGYGHSTAIRLLKVNESTSLPLYLGFVTTGESGNILSGNAYYLLIYLQSSLATDRFARTLPF